MAYLGQEEELRELQYRFRFLYFGLLGGIILIVSRLFFLQVLNGEKMRLYSEENRIKRVKIAAPRGMIFDRKGTLLLDNRPAFDLEIIPQYLRGSGVKEPILKRLSHLIKMPVPELEIILDKAKGQPTFIPVKIKTDLSRQEVALIETWKLDMPGVQIQQEIRRTNLYGDIAAHLLGYIGEVSPLELPLINKAGEKYKLGDSIGKFGIEQKLEDVLRGVDGEKLVEVDALGRIKLQGKGFKKGVLNQALEKPAVPGKNISLTVDQDLQLAAVKAFGDKSGAVVAIDPNTGAILSMVSRPAFDPTEFSRGIPQALWAKLIDNENRPLRDKTIQDHYPPGSVFKTITAIAGLEEGVIDEHTHFTCTGSVTVGNRVFHCHKKGGHGEVDVIQALVQSCDVFFYRTAQRLKSVDDLAKWAFHLGLGRKTGIPLSREVPGLIPTEEWKRKYRHEAWNAGETLSVAIGQGAVLTTVLQLANVYASIANGGTQYRPYFVKEIRSIDEKVLIKGEPEILDQTRLKNSTADLIRKALWGVANLPSGTMYSNRLPGMGFAGKTGTAQVIGLKKDKVFSRCENFKYKDRHHGVFAGFAPADNPKIAIAVIAEHACHGATGAGPIAKAVIEAYLKKYETGEFTGERLQARIADEKKILSEFKNTKAFVSKAPETDEDVPPDAPEEGNL